MQTSSCLDASIGSRHQGKPWIKHAPTIVTVGVALILAIHGPIAQPVHYNEFADQSAAFGIHHAADVLSNAGFALVAIWGWLALRRRRATSCAPGGPATACF